MTALRHSAVRVDPAEPCPFCGSGGTALRDVARPRRQTRRNVTRARHNYSPCTCAFCEEGRRLSAVPGHSAHTVGELVAATKYLGGNCSAVRSEDAATVSPAYQAHLDAGEVAVPDVAAGGYRWEKGGNAA